jgi:hypothetical protein
MEGWLQAAGGEFVRRNIVSDFASLRAVGDQLLDEIMQLLPSLHQVPILMQETDDFSFATCASNGLSIGNVSLHDREITPDPGSVTPLTTLNPPTEPYYTYAISMAKDRPRNATAAHGVTGPWPRGRLARFHPGGGRNGAVLPVVSSS